jgi:hypothetical protein
VVGGCSEEVRSEDIIDVDEIACLGTVAADGDRFAS